MGSSGKYEMPRFFFVHTHSCPSAIDRDLLLGLVVVVEQSPERLSRYYGQNIQPCNLRNFLEKWPDLRSCWSLSSRTKTILALEGLGGSLDIVKNLGVYYTLGLRIIQPYHWISVPYFENGSLTRFGRELLHRMRELDMILDVSHMPSRTLAESLDVFDGKILASHVVSRDALDSRMPRANSLSSDDIKRLVGRPSLIGIPFVNDLISSDKCTLDGRRSVGLDDIVHQATKIMAIAGDENVAFGPDYFDFKGYEDMLGIPLCVPADLDTSDGLKALYERLVKSELTAKQVQALTHANALRFFKEIFDPMDTYIENQKQTPSMGSSCTDEIPWIIHRPYGPEIIEAATQNRCEAPALPTHAWISLSNYCNLSCLHCRRHYRKIDDIDQQRDIPERLWEAITQELIPGLNSLILGGNNLSEVTCATRFPEIVRYLSNLSNKPSISVQTNGSIIKNYLLEALVDMNTMFNISIEGGTNETTKRVRGIPLDSIGQRIGHINTLRFSRQSRTRIVLSFTATRTNITELPALVEFAERNGVDEVNVMFLLPATQEWNVESPVQDIQRVNQVIEETYQLCEKWHVRLLAPLIKSVENNQMCSRPWFSVSVNGDGDVRSCCLEDSPPLGNLLVSTLVEIWNGASAALLRSAVNGADPRGECSYCVLRNLPIVSSQILQRQLVGSDNI